MDDMDMERQEGELLKITLDRIMVLDGGRVLLFTVKRACRMRSPPPLNPMRRLEIGLERFQKAKKKGLDFDLTP